MRPSSHRMRRMPSSLAALRGLPSAGSAVAAAVSPAPRVVPEQAGERERCRFAFAACWVRDEQRGDVGRDGRAPPMTREELSEW